MIDYKTQAEFRLIKLFVGLVLFGIDIMLPRNKLGEIWSREKEKFDKELVKYEKDYLAPVAQVIEPRTSRKDRFSNIRRHKF